MDRFHNNLIVIVTTSECTAEEYRRLTSTDPILRDDDTITCITGVKPVESIPRFGLFQKTPSKTMWEIPTGETKTEDLDVIQETWQHCTQFDDDDTILTLEGMEAFVILRHCWELLQAIVKRKSPKSCLTPGTFWRGAMKYKDLFVIAPYSKRRELMTDFPWYESGDVLRVHEDEWQSDPKNSDVVALMREHFSKSLKTGYIDQRYKQLLWDTMEVYQYLPIDE